MRDRNRQQRNKAQRNKTFGLRTPPNIVWSRVLRWSSFYPSFYTTESPNRSLNCRSGLKEKGRGRSESKINCTIHRVLQWHGIVMALSRHDETLSSPLQTGRRTRQQVQLRNCAIEMSFCSLCDHVRVHNFTQIYSSILTVRLPLSSRLSS